MIKKLFDKKYLVATSNFLTNGGDEFAKINATMQLEDLQTTNNMIRGSMYHYLKTQEMINTRQNPIIKPDKPRLIITSVSE